MSQPKVFPITRRDMQSSSESSKYKNNNGKTSRISPYIQHFQNIMTNLLATMVHFGIRKCHQKYSI